MNLTPGGVLYLQSPQTAVKMRFAKLGALELYPGMHGLALSSYLTGGFVLWFSLSGG